jgi:hypothetical protein
MIGRNSAGVVFFCAGFALCLCCGRDVALGYLSGALASSFSFFILRKGLIKGCAATRTRLFYMIAMGLRVIVAAAIFSFSIMCRAHPLGIFAGITCTLILQVMSLAGSRVEKVC